MGTPTKKSRKGLIVGISAAAVLAALGMASAGSSTAPASSAAQMQSAAVVNAVAPIGTTDSAAAAPQPAAQEQSAAAVNGVVPSTSPSPVPDAAQAEQVQAAPQQSEAQPTQEQQGSDLSNNSYYTNSAGDQVHSPAYDTDSDVPAGASARCGDGTYSFSESHRGTCSHHGGVSEWLK